MQQTIYRSTHTSGFSVLPNAIPTNTSLSAHARLALIYLLGKPPTWKMRITDVKRAIGCGVNKAYRCLNELIKAGYARMIRGQSRVDWFFYDTPQSSAESDRDGFHHVKNGDDLVKTDSVVITEKNNNTAPAIKQPEQSVVVFDAGAETEPPPQIPLPDILKGSQAKAAHKLLSNVTAEQIITILAIFNTATKVKKINNPVGYLHSLVKAAQNGTLTAPESHTAAKQITAGERIAKEQAARKQAQKRLKVDNDKWLEMMSKQFGSRILGMR